MINYRGMLGLGLLFMLSSFASGAVSAGPAGEWLVKDKTAHIRIVECGRKLWGAISWASAPGTDSNNPDPDLRDRPVLGMAVLLGMHPAAEGWDGPIYNADNGKTYAGNITLKSEAVLHVKGCVLAGLLCGGEDWTRIEAEPDKETADMVCAKFLQK